MAARPDPAENLPPSGHSWSPHRLRDHSGESADRDPRPAPYVVQLASTFPLLCGMKAMDGRVSSGLAMFLTCLTGLSCGPIAFDFSVPCQISSIGPISSTRIMQAWTQ